MGTQDPPEVVTPVGVAFWKGFAMADLVITCLCWDSVCGRIHCTLFIWQPPWVLPSIGPRCASWQPLGHDRHRDGALMIGCFKLYCLSLYFGPCGHSIVSTESTTNHRHRHFRGRALVHDRNHSAFCHNHFRLIMRDVPSPLYFVLTRYLNCGIDHVAFGFKGFLAIYCYIIGRLKSFFQVCTQTWRTKN